MRKLSIVVLLMMFQLSLMAQILEPVKWKYSTKSLSDGNIELLFTATMDDGWHLYSQKTDPNEGPIPTSFTFNDSDDYELIGSVQEENPEVAYDPNFEMDIAMFEGEVIFVQEIKKVDGTMNVTGMITFMVCNDEQCIFPPEFKFEIKIEE